MSLKHARSIPDPPPPHFKGRMARGLRNGTLAVDLGAQILAAQIRLSFNETCILRPNLG
jgi:hypothetical protein